MSDRDFTVSTDGSNEVDITLADEDVTVGTHPSGQPFIKLRQGLRWIITLINGNAVSIKYSDYLHRVRAYVAAAGGKTIFAFTQAFGGKVAYAYCKAIGGKLAWAFTQGPPSQCGLRNGDGRDVETYHESDRTAIPNTGTLTLIRYLNWPGVNRLHMTNNVVGSEDYLYYGHCTLSAGYAYYYVNEYNIKTGETITVGPLESGEDTDLDGDSIAYIIDRKIICLVDFSGYAGLSTWIVDFEDQSYTTTVTDDYYPICVRCLKKENGEIWLYVCCWTATGYKVHYAQYDESISWSSTSVSDTYAGYLSAIFCTEDYLLWFVPWYQGTTPPETVYCHAIVFNTTNFSLTKTSDVSYAPSCGVYNTAVSQAAVDLSNSKAYVVVSGMGNNIYTPPYDVYRWWLSFDPSTLSFVTLKSEARTGTGGGVTYVSKEKVYIYDPVDGAMYERGTTQVGTISKTLYGPSMLMDDNGPSIVGWHNTDYKLYAYSIAGSLLWSKSFGASGNIVSVSHLGKCLTVLQAYQTGTFPNYIYHRYFYLLT